MTTMFELFGNAVAEFASIVGLGAIVLSVCYTAYRFLTRKKGID
jgi:hypothetical protein